MPEQIRIVSPGPSPRTVYTADGTLLTLPGNWEILPPGDPGLTRRVKAAGPTWTIQVKKGRKIFSQGVCAPAERIETLRAELEQERSSENYVKRRLAEGARREKKQEQYVEDFEAAVFAFLNFLPEYTPLARQFAGLVAAHATPVGSGTVARTQRIPIEQRAEAAVIAWMRHQTTAYDQMQIPRIKGKRREVRRMLAEKSRELLARYRTLEFASSVQCPLHQALYASATPPENL